VNTKAMEQELEAGIVASLRAPGSDSPNKVQRIETSLPDQLAQLDRIRRAAADKIRREGLAIRNNYERQTIEIRSAFASRISDEVSKLEQARDAELLALTEETSQKLHDLERLARRQS
jgi:hypothetical protein